jgi:hypothetical protein
LLLSSGQSAYRAGMPDFTGVQWQPIGQLPVFEQLIGGMLAETLAFQGTLVGVVGRPQALDDATLDRVQQQYRERAEYLDLYEEQFRRWRAAGLTSEQAQTVDGFSVEVQRTRPVVGQVLALVDQLREDTIDRVTELSDLELGLMTVLGLTPAEFKKRKQQG